MCLATTNFLAFYLFKASACEISSTKHYKLVRNRNPKKFSPQRRALSSTLWTTILKKKNKTLNRCLLGIFCFLFIPAVTSSAFHLIRVRYKLHTHRFSHSCHHLQYDSNCRYVKYSLLNQGTSLSREIRSQLITDTQSWIMTRTKSGRTT